MTNLPRNLQATLLRWALLFTVMVAALSASSAAVACPTCKDAVAANDPEHQHMVRGYFYSILFMMGMPYLLITCFGLYMYREVRKARARNAKAPDAAPTATTAISTPSSSQLPRLSEPNELLNV